jgi:hypothetical protein
VSATTSSGLVSLLGLDPATYAPHEIHVGDRAYTETNCYTDIVVELLHARGDEPFAALGAAVRLDFEGDQWTFLKPPEDDLRRLFGIDIHEMQPYRPIPDQVAEQLVAGRTMIVELDSFYLPDTAATSYRREHVKSSVVMEAIDRDAERLRYFHNASLHELEGEDYRGVFRLGRVFAPDVLPPYTELVRFDAGPRLAGDALRREARALLRRHLALRPRANPFDAFAHQLDEALPALLAGDAADYHDYAFATVRMAGAGFELAAAHVDWLLGEPAAAATASLRSIVDACKTLSFKLARRRPFDPRGQLEPAREAWQDAMRTLDRLVD